MDKESVVKLVRRLANRVNDQELESIRAAWNEDPEKGTAILGIVLCGHLSEDDL